MADRSMWLSGTDKIWYPVTLLVENNALSAVDVNGNILYFNTRLVWKVLK